jgi:hypothetical protein
MSDISDDSSFNLGLVKNASDNFGPTAVASQANTKANTALVQQQTQGAEIANTSARLQYQLFARAVGHLTDFSGQDGPTLGKSADDASGVTATSALPSATTPPAAQGKVTPEMDIGASASDQALIESTLEKNYNINPMGTPQEQQAIVQAEKEATAAKLSGHPGLAASADQKITTLKDLRDMNVGTRKNAAQLDAAQHFDKFDAVTNAPKGGAWAALKAVAPDSAGKILQKNKDATPEELDKIARDTTSHVGAFLHRFTDRPIKVGDDNVTYDEKSGMRVGVPIRGVTPERQAELLKQANEVKTFKNTDGTDTTETQSKHDGYDNPHAWVTDAVNQIRARNGGNSAVEAKRADAAKVPVRPQPQPGQPQPGQPQPGQPQPGQPQPGQPQPGAPAGAPPQKDNGLLPGINPDTLPKVNSVPTKQGTSQKPGDKTTQEGIATESLAQQKESNGAFVEAQKTGALIRAAQREAATLEQNPRMTGPGSEIAQGWAKIKTFVNGQPPDELVNLGSLDKILMTMGAQNVRQALQGQKITNQEFMTLMTKGNPNTEQPLPTINNLLKYLSAQNEYEQRFQRTKQIALQRGANPMTVDGDIGSQVDRGDFVEGKVGVRPPLAGGKQGGGSAPSVTTQEAYDKLKKGDPYLDENGKPHTKGGK